MDRFLDNAKDAVVQVQCANGVGSAFFVNEYGNLFTAAHVVVDHSWVKIRNKHFATIAKVVYVDTDKDVAVLEVENKAGLAFHFFELRSFETLQRGESVVSIGFPSTGLEDLNVNCSQGIILGVEHDEEFSVRIIKSTCLIAGGSTGCPLIDARGRAVGIVTATDFRSDPDRPGYFTQEVLLTEAVSVEAVFPQYLKKIYWDTRQPQPACTQQLPERCHALKFQCPPMAVGTNYSQMQIFNLQNPLVGSIEGRVGLHHVDDAQSKNFTFTCYGKEAETCSVNSLNSLSFHPVHCTFGTSSSDGSFNFWDKDIKQRPKAIARCLYPPIPCRTFNNDDSVVASWLIRSAMIGARVLGIKMLGIKRQLQGRFAYRSMKLWSSLWN